MLRIRCWGFIISLVSLLSLATGQNSSMTGTFCVAIPTADQTALLAGLNWACGPGGANCQPIQEGQSCYVANNLAELASYAYNDYYHKVGGASGACNFNNTAAPTNTDPSHDSCIFVGSTGTNSSTGSTPSPPSTFTSPPPGFTPPSPGFTPNLFSPPPPGFGGLTNATSPTGTDGTFGALGNAISLRVLYVPYVLVVMLHLFSSCM